MLLALLNICSKEELEESDDEASLPQTPVEDPAERRRVIKNKILAVGRMSRVFALLRSVCCLACRTFFAPLTTFISW
jgi:serine/threonine-protein phosphatase 2B catalytic subunit